jgi:hypothetical protein
MPCLRTCAARPAVRGALSHATYASTAALMTLLSSQNNQELQVPISGSSTTGTPMIGYIQLLF